MIGSNVALAFGPWMVRLADVPPLVSAFWRLLLAIPFLLLLTVAARQPMPRISFRLLGVIAIGGLFFAADLGLWHIGILHTKLANASLLANIASFVLAGWALVVHRSLPDRPMGAALLLAVAGTMLLLGRSYDLDQRNFVGDLTCLLAGLLYTGYLLAMTRARDSVQAVPLLLLSTLAGMGPLLIFALAVGGPFMPTDWTPLLMLALGSQVIGQGLMVYAMGHLSPLLIGLGLLIQPFISASIGSVYYGERLGLLDILGGLAICIALVLARLSRTGQPPSASLDTTT